MNAQNMARTAYNPVTTPLRTPRSTEYEAFAQVTRKLRQAHDAPANDIQCRASALHENRNLWTFFAASVADSGNALPKELRAQLFYLAEFTALHSRRVLKGESSFDILIEVNTSIMRGLRTDEVTE